MCVSETDGQTDRVRKRQRERDSLCVIVCVPAGACMSGKAYPGPSHDRQSPNLLSQPYFAELRTQKLRSRQPGSVENPELTNVLPLILGVDQSIATHVSPAGRNCFLV